MLERHDDPMMHVGGLDIHPSDGLVLAEGRPVMLSVREHQLLVVLASAEGAIVPRKTLYEQVWGGALRDGNRTVDVYVHKLRTKLERAEPKRQFIHTHVGFGYRFAPGPASDAA